MNLYEMVVSHMHSKSERHMNITRRRFLADFSFWKKREKDLFSCGCPPMNHGTWLPFFFFLRRASRWQLHWNSKPTDSHKYSNGRKFFAPDLATPFRNVCNDANSNGFFNWFSIKRNVEFHHASEFISHFGAWSRIRRMNWIINELPHELKYSTRDFRCWPSLLLCVRSTNPCVYCFAIALASEIQ